MGEYAIICPSCDGTMDDTNRVASTMLGAFKGRPGGTAYVYVYRCPSCGSRITWTYPVMDPLVEVTRYGDDPDA